MNGWREAVIWILVPVFAVWLGYVTDQIVSLLREIRDATVDIQNSLNEALSSLHAIESKSKTGYD